MTTSGMYNGKFYLTFILYLSIELNKVPVSLLKTLGYHQKVEFLVDCSPLFLDSGVFAVGLLGLIKR
jgi:hypothetical protein